MNLQTILLLFLILPCNDKTKPRSPVVKQDSIENHSSLKNEYAGQSIEISDPMTDAILVGGSQNCNQGWKPIAIKNNSTDKFLNVTIEATTKSGTNNPVRKTLVFSKMSPQEQIDLGCKGCGDTTTGQLCSSYKILAAVYVN